MSKKTTRRTARFRRDRTPGAGDTENPRRPCPCGSGRRYKACHGAADAADLIVTRPFAGLAAETELIALREFVPSASAPLTPASSRRTDVPSVTLASVLPGAAAALTRGDGSILLGMQVQTHTGDLSRDLAAALEWALAAEPSIGAVGDRPGDASARGYGDLIVDEPLEVTVHADFSWWLEEEPEPAARSRCPWSGRTRRSCRPPGWPS